MQNGNIKKYQTSVYKVEFTAQKLTIRCRKNTDRTNVNVTLVAECFHIHILNIKSPNSVPPFRMFLPFPPPTLKRLFFKIRHTGFARSFPFHVVPCCTIREYFYGVTLLHGGSY